MEGKDRSRERRRAERTAGEEITIVLHEAGSTAGTVMRGRIRNISDRGICVVTRDKIKERTYVTFRVESWDWSGGGSARHCTPVRTQYLVGVELSSGVKRPTDLGGQPPPLPPAMSE